MTETSDISEAIAAGIAVASPEVIGSALAPFALQRLVPEGYEVVTSDIETYLTNPRRSRGTVHPATADALIAYLERFGDDRLTVWVHPTSGRVESVLDDHHPAVLSERTAEGSPTIHLSPEVPGHGEHRAVLDLQRTPEWITWTHSDDNWFTQVEFAEFIEANGKEVKEPSAADLLELAQTFHAQSDSTFRSAKRLHDGNTQLQYVENVNAQAGVNGDLIVPSDLELLIRPFIGEPLYRVTARFRYRVTGGALKLQYKLDRPDDVVRDALDQVAKRLADTFDNVYTGEPRR